MAKEKCFITPPTPHPSFSQYLVQATTRLGIVWIKGVSSPIDNDNFGFQTSALVDRISEQLAKRYGRGVKTDQLFNGSIWNDPQDWLQGLAHNERVYNYFWSRKARAQLPSDIETIFVGAVAIGPREASVHLEYASSSMAAAEAEMEQDMADLL